MSKSPLPLVRKVVKIGTLVSMIIRPIKDREPTGLPHSGVRQIGQVLLVGNWII